MDVRRISSVYAVREVREAELEQVYQLAIRNPIITNAARRE